MPDSRSRWIPVRHHLSVSGKIQPWSILNILRFGCVLRRPKCMLGLLAMMWIHNELSNIDGPLASTSDRAFKSRRQPTVRSVLTTCLNGLQKPYDPMVFLRTAGDAKKARHCLMIQGITRNVSTSISMNFLSLSTVGDIIFYFEMNRIWLLPCPLLPRMHLVRSCSNGLQKPYDPMVFLHTAADAKKARHHLARMTETCNQLMSPHMKCKTDLLPTGHI